MGAPGVAAYQLFLIDHHHRVGEQRVSAACDFPHQRALMSIERGRIPDDGPARAQCLIKLVQTGPQNIPVAPLVGTRPTSLP